MKKAVTMICLLLFMFECTKNSASVSETNTGQIKGWVVNEDDKVVKGAQVILRSVTLPVAAAPKASLPSLGKVAQPGDLQADTTTTSSKGSFSFDSVAIGDYYIEINDRDSRGALVEASITDNTTVQIIDTVVIKPFASITGSLDESLITSESTYLYLIELDRKVPIDSLGIFLITNVPERDYTIRLIENENITTSVLDTVIITVEEQDTVKAFYLGSKTGIVTIDGTIEE
jgi:hypothetical protein